MNARRVLTAAYVMIVVSGFAWAQTVKVDSQQTKLLLAASSTETMQQELNRASELGFRVVTATFRFRSCGTLVQIAGTDRYEIKFIG